MKRSDISELEQEVRRSKVLALNNRGYNQQEIADRLDVDRSTISRDLDHRRVEARRRIEAAVKNAAFEFVKYFEGLDQIKKELWEISDSSANNNANPDPHVNSHNKDRIAALTLPYAML